MLTSFQPDTVARIIDWLEEAADDAVDYSLCPDAELAAAFVALAGILRAQIPNPGPTAARHTPRMQ